MIEKLRLPIVIELGDDNKVTVSHHGLVNVSQEYDVDALYTPMFRPSLLPINQLDIAGYTSTFGRGKCSISSPSTTMTGNHVNNRYIISSATALTLTVPSMSTKSTSRRRNRKRDRVSSSAHFTVPSITHSTKPTTSSPHTTSRRAASTIPQCPLGTVFPKPTRTPLPISELHLSHRRLAHIHPTTLRSLIDGSSKSRPVALQSDLNQYIRMCVDHSLRLPPPAIATISYSTMITHATPVFESSQIRSRKHTPQPTIQI